MTEETETPDEKAFERLRKLAKRSLHGVSPLLAAVSQRLVPVVLPPITRLVVSGIGHV
jgi:hypothetical protein